MNSHELDDTLIERAREFFKVLQRGGVRLLREDVQERRWFLEEGGKKRYYTLEEKRAHSRRVKSARRELAQADTRGRRPPNSMHRIPPLRQETIVVPTFEFAVTRDDTCCTFEQAIDPGALPGVCRELRARKNAFDPVIWVREEYRLINNPANAFPQLGRAFPAYFAAWQGADPRGKLTALFARIMECGKVRSFDRYYGKEHLMDQMFPPPLPLAPPNPLAPALRPRIRPAFYCAVCQKTTAQIKWEQHYPCLLKVWRGTL